MLESGRAKRSRRTPGLTRRPERLKVSDNSRVGGRVHAVVRRAFIYYSLLTVIFYNTRSGTICP